LEQILEALQSYPAAATFALLVLCGLGLPPWSEELVILASGYFVAQDAMSFGEAVFWCYAGIIAGDSIIYGLGAWVGERVYRWPILRAHMNTRQRNKFNRLFLRHGALAVFFARFIPGYRMVAYFVAGNLGMRYPKFLLLDSIGAALTVPISVYLGFVLADNLDQAQEMFHRYQIPIALAVIVGIVVAIRVRKQRRLQRLSDLQRQRIERRDASARQQRDTK